jgi:hypothetical protein
VLIHFPWNGINLKTYRIDSNTKTSRATAAIAQAVLGIFLKLIIKYKDAAITKNSPI